MENFENYLEKSKDVIISDFEKKLKYSDSTFLIEQELKQIKNFEDSVDVFSKYYNTSFLTKYRTHIQNDVGVLISTNDHRNQLEYLRIKTGYYNENVNRKKNSNTAFVIAQIIHFKDYLLERKLHLTKKEKTNIHNKQAISKNSTKNNYSQRQIAIAYFILGTRITEDNYSSILKKHSQTTSKKILQKLITKSSQINKITSNKTADTKHLNDLKAAKRLLRGIKKESAINQLKLTITAFQISYDNQYQ